MTAAEYPDYMNRVLAKTDGANIHRVNGLLGIAGSAAMRIEKRKTNRHDEADAWDEADRVMIVNAKLEIKKLTGVS